MHPQAEAEPNPGAVTAPAATRIPLGLIALMVSTHISFGGMRLALTLAALQQGASALALGLLLSLFMLVPIFTSMPTGRWSDRRGHVSPVAIGLMLILCGGLVGSLFHQLPALALIAVLVGTGQSMVHVAGLQGIGRTADQYGSARVFSAVSLGFSMSGFAGPVLAGLLMDAVGPGGAFLGLCLPAVVALAMAYRLTKVSPAAMAPAQGTSRATPRQPGLLREPALQALLVTTALLTMSWDLFTFVMPLHATGIGLSATAIGSVAGSFSVGSFAIRLVLGRMAARTGEEPILWFALASAVVCYVAFPFTSGFYSLAAVAFLLGVVLGCGQPMAMSLLHRRSPAQRSGEVMGVRSVITSVSQTVLPVAFGALGAAFGTGPLFWAVAATLVGGMAWARRRI